MAEADLELALLRAERRAWLEGWHAATTGAETALYAGEDALCGWLLSARMLGVNKRDVERGWPELNKSGWKP